MKITNFAMCEFIDCKHYNKFKIDENGKIVAIVNECILCNHRFNDSYYAIEKKK